MQNKAVQGILRIIGGVSEMLIGSEFCATGAVQGVIMIAFGANMAFEGIGDIWNAVNGNEEQGTNLFKEITGHKADNLVDVAELGVGIRTVK